jgi:glutathione S-transferase
MQPYLFTFLVVLLAVLLMIGLTLNVGRARAIYQIRAPATSGHDLFERAFRVQQNTLESVIMFLPALCLYAFLIGDKGAGIAGSIWIIGRLWYAVAYQREPAQRGIGFMISFLMVIGLWIGATYGLFLLYFKV